MIPDSLRNRTITRICISIVAAISPAALLFTLYILFFHQTILNDWKDPRFALFGWCIAESVFWGWSVAKYKSRSLKFDRIVPTFEERQKLKADCLWIIESSPGGAIRFIQGWFNTRKRTARIEDLQQGNIKDWYYSLCNILMVGYVGRILRVLVKMSKQILHCESRWKKHYRNYLPV